MFFLERWFSLVLPPEGAALGDQGWFCLRAEAGWSAWALLQKCSRTLAADPATCEVPGPRWKRGLGAPVGWGVGQLCAVD